MTSPPSTDDSRASDDPDLVLIVPGLNGRSSATEAYADPRFTPAPEGAFIERDNTANAFSDVEANGQFEHRRQAALPWEAELMLHLGLMAKETASGSAIPAAQLLYQNELAERRPEAPFAVMADPIALTPGRDEAALTPPEALALESAELDDLFAAVNGLLVDDGLNLVRGADDRHYLIGLDPASLDTLPTHALAQRDIGRHLPSASDAGSWRRLMTEIQMLWHTHPVNEQRAMSGRTPINGIWFWGGAALPKRPAITPSVCVVADDALALALSGHAGVPSLRAATLEQALDDKATGSIVIVDLSAYQAWLAADSNALDAARRTMKTQWIEPAAKAVADGRVASLLVLSGDGHESSFVPARPVTPFQQLIDALRSLVKKRPDVGSRPS